MKAAQEALSLVRTDETLTRYDNACAAARVAFAAMQLAGLEVRK
jgi:hypothetical protein